jgi:hypothetical protein
MSVYQIDIEGFWRRWVVTSLFEDIPGQLLPRKREVDRMGPLSWRAARRWAVIEEAALVGEGHVVIDREGRVAVPFYHKRRA